MIDVTVCYAALKVEATVKLRRELEEIRKARAISRPQRPASRQEQVQSRPAVRGIHSAIVSQRLILTVLSIFSGNEAYKVKYSDHP